MAGYKQLCWKCKKACNKHLCIWVATLKLYPRGCVLDNNGNISFCPLFVDDKKLYSNNDLAKSLGLKLCDYNRILYQVKKAIKNYGIEANIEECLKFMQKYNCKVGKYTRLKVTLKKHNCDLNFDFVYNELIQKQISITEFFARRERKCKMK